MKPDLEDRVRLLLARDIHRRQNAGSPVSMPWDEDFYVWDAKREMDELRPSELLAYISAALEQTAPEPATSDENISGEIELLNFKNQQQ
jgi:hypothetical protein